jgi:sporulation protein YlmC with PRC-barrel domain
MKTASYRYFALFIALAVVAGPLAVQAQTVDIVRVDVLAVGKGYRVSQLLGRDVINEQNEELGEIDDFIIGRDQVLFVVLEVGGFLGVGARLVALPATAIDMESVKGKIRIKSASRSQLQKMPEFKYGSDQGKSEQGKSKSRSQ